MSDIGLKCLPGGLARVVEVAEANREGVAIATFAGFCSEGRFLVALPDAAEPTAALSTVGLGAEDVGAQIAVAFENGEARRPVIIGRLRGPAETPAPVLKVDGERVVFRAEKEIELRCGEASIVLTSAGKVLIRGSYVLSRSRGANKIKGAFIDIN